MYRSPLEDFFNTDPFFSDPFFASPFPSPFGSVFAPPRQQNPRRTPSVTIEEVSEDTSDNEAEYVEPIVEQPESEGSYHNEPRRRPHSHNALHEPLPLLDPFVMMQGMMQGMMPGMMPAMMPAMMPGSGFGGFSNLGSSGAYSSSSVQSFHSSGNGQTVHYSKTSTTKAGPSGLVEKQETERDSSTGLERISLHRQLGDRARTVTRERRHGSEEMCRENLRGISQEEATAFDQEWTAAAGQHLHSHSRRANRSTPAITSNAHSALPIDTRQEYDSRSRSSAPANYHQSTYDMRSHPYMPPTAPRASSYTPSASMDSRYDTRPVRNTQAQPPHLNSYNNHGDFYR